MRIDKRGYHAKPPMYSMVEAVRDEWEERAASLTIYDAPVPQELEGSITNAEHILDYLAGHPESYAAGGYLPVMEVRCPKCGKVLRPTHSRNFQRGLNQALGHRRKWSGPDAWTVGCSCPGTVGQMGGWGRTKRAAVRDYLHGLPEDQRRAQIWWKEPERAAQTEKALHPVEAAAAAEERVEPKALPWLDEVDDDYGVGPVPVPKRRKPWAWLMETLIGGVMGRMIQRIKWKY